MLADENDYLSSSVTGGSNVVDEYCEVSVLGWGAAQVELIGNDLFVCNCSVVPVTGGGLNDGCLCVTDLEYVTDWLLLVGHEFSVDCDVVVSWSESWAEIVRVIERTSDGIGALVAWAKTGWGIQVEVGGHVTSLDVVEGNVEIGSEWKICWDIYVVLVVVSFVNVSSDWETVGSHLLWCQDGCLDGVLYWLIEELWWNTVDGYVVLGVCLQLAWQEIECATVGIGRVCLAHLIV